MRINEFEKKYCVDILEKEMVADMIVDDVEFTYDAIINLQDGTPVKIVYDDAGNEIQIEDILTLQDTDFIRAYPHPLSLEMYNQYLAAFVILEGEEVLEALRVSIKESKAKIDKFADLPSEAFE